ncbi:MAG TPA: hypothetical protein VFP97_08335 [Chitinophagaceae bacterium]|nr:hypothetical protein [Chitinophagaceae bacterium]
MKILLALTLFLTAITFQSVAQDVSGYWKGTLSMRGCFPENNIELQINGKGEIVAGDSYHYQDIDNYVKKNFKGKFDKETKKLSVQEGIVTTYHIPQRCVICVKNFELVYSREGKVETLKGYWNGNVLGSAQSCDGGSIVLTRIKESAFKEIPEIKVDTGNIKLDFYDNAQVDGDSITVLVDKQVVLTHQRLTAKPLTTYVRIDLNNTFHEIEMVAENLGSIPPNTAILIITAGKNRHLLSLSSSETKSARVRIVYDQEVSKSEQTVASVIKEEEN